MIDEGLLFCLIRKKIDSNKSKRSNIERRCSRKCDTLYINAAAPGCKWYGKCGTRIKISTVRAFASYDASVGKCRLRNDLFPFRTTRQFLDDLIGDAPWQFLHLAESRHVSARSRVNQGVHARTRAYTRIRMQYLVAKEYSSPSQNRRVAGALSGGHNFLKHSEIRETLWQLMMIFLRRSRRFCKTSWKIV